MGRVARDRAAAGGLLFGVSRTSPLVVPQVVMLAFTAGVAWTVPVVRVNAAGVMRGE